jgi:hypothetical protein
MTDEQVYPISGQSGSGTHISYSVEARSTYIRPQQVGDIILDQRWQRLFFPKSPIGVPSSSNIGEKECGLMTYSAAQALRWWFIAELESSFKHLCVETRIVKHLVKYSYSEEITKHFEAESAVFVDVEKQP